MIIEALKGKIHRATVTEADLNYIGSLTLDEDLMVAAGLMEFEKIQVLDITNGNRLETYVIKGKRGSGEVCINGAAAHLVKKGDLVIIVAYCQLIDNESLNHKPKIVYVDGENKIIPKPSKEKIYL
ncbi:MAG: aspartate 1-decarboxylase [Candidatus Neomarinimicrobiota bacterium]|nr:aspartate 1-decarboxylase [Candidatus Neomarinimicrobiota bacterium]